MSKIREKVLFVSDFHMPYCDGKSVIHFLKYLENNEVDKLILGGDMIDFYQISHFRKDPMRVGTLQDDLDTYYELMDNIREVYDGDMIMLVGNHETRIHSYLEENPGLYGLDSLKLKSILRAKEYDFTLEYNYSYKDVWFTHGKYANKYFAEKNIRMNMMSTVCGHVHRHMTFCKTGKEKDFISIGAPCMCDTLEQDYTKGKPNWQNGYLVLNFNSYRLLNYEVKFTR